MSHLILHSGYFPSVPGSESLFMSCSYHSLFNIVKYAMGKYYKYKISASHKNILQKSIKSIFSWIRQGLNRGPWGYETCMLPKSYRDLQLQRRLFNESLQKYGTKVKTISKKKILNESYKSISNHLSKPLELWDETKEKIVFEIVKWSFDCRPNINHKTWPDWQTSWC